MLERENLGARLWLVAARVGLGRGVDCGGEVGFLRAAWIAEARVGFGARRGLWGWDDGNAEL